LGQLYLNWDGSFLLTQNQSQLLDTSDMSWSDSAEVAVDGAFWLETGEILTYTFDEVTEQSSIVHYVGLNGPSTDADKLELKDQTEVDMQVLMHQQYGVATYLVGARAGRLVAEFYIATQDE